MNGTGITANLVFHYNQTDVNGNENNYRIHRKNGASTVGFPNVCPTTTCVDPAANTGTVSGVASFSDWTMAEIVAPTAANASVSGRVTALDGRGVSYARVTMTGVNGQPRTTIANSFGYYSFEDVPTGAGYVFVATAKGFNPEQVVRTIGDDVTDLNFVLTR